MQCGSGMHQESKRQEEKGETMNAPCLDCKRRTVGCHSVCEDYSEFKTEQKKVAEAKLEYINPEVYGYKSEGRTKTNMRRTKEWKRRH